MNIDLSNSPADESQFEDYKEAVIEKLINDLQNDFNMAKKKKDLDDILKKYKFKIIKNNKIASPMQEKMAIKRKIIEFGIHEPEDMFNLDMYCQKFPKL